MRKITVPPYLGLSPEGVLAKVGVVVVVGKAELDGIVAAGLVVVSPDAPHEFRSNRLEARQDKNSNTTLFMSMTPLCNCAVSLGKPQRDYAASLALYVRAVNQIDER